MRVPEADLRVKDLRELLVQEREELHSLQAAVSQLEQDVSHTEAQDSVTVEDSIEEHSEWKTRFDSQQIVNSQLHSQQNEFREKLKQSKLKLKTINQGGESEFKGADGKLLMIKLQREKTNLESQLRDYEWRLDQEATSFHKVDEKRKNLFKDVQSVRRKAEQKLKQEMMSAKHKPEVTSGLRKSDAGGLPGLPRRASVSKHGGKKSKTTLGAVHESKSIKLPPIIP